MVCANSMHAQFSLINKHQFEPHKTDDFSAYFSKIVTSYASEESQCLYSKYVLYVSYLYVLFLVFQPTAVIQKNGRTLLIDFKNTYVIVGLKMNKTHHFCGNRNPNQSKVFCTHDKYVLHRVSCGNR